MRPLDCWDCGFESHRGHGCLLSAVCCQAEVSVTSWSPVQRRPTDCGGWSPVQRRPTDCGGWSPVQRRPTDCGASLCVIYKPRERRGPGPLWGLFRQKQTNKTKVTPRSIMSGDQSVSRDSATLRARVNNRNIFARNWVYTRLRHKTNNFNIFNNFLLL